MSAFGYWYVLTQRVAVPAIERLRGRMRCFHFRGGSPGLRVGRRVSIVRTKNGEATTGNNCRIDADATIRSLQTKAASKSSVGLGHHVHLKAHSIVSCRDGDLRIGDHSAVGRGTLINCAFASLHIGQRVRIAGACFITTANHAFDSESTPIMEQGHRSADVIIGDDVWIGWGVVILPGVRIGAGSVIGAGAVVTRSVVDGAVVGGVPSRVLRMRGSAGQGESK